MKILKFGEQSLANEKHIRTVAGILSRNTENTKNQPAVIVLSALEGVKSLLLAASSHAKAGESTYIEGITQIREKHHETLKHLFPAAEQTKVITPIQILLNDLEDILHGVQLLSELSSRTRALVLSFGVKLSAILLCHYLQREGFNALIIDAGEMIQSDNTYDNAQVDFKGTYKLIPRRLAGEKGICIIPGGIASAIDGATTLLMGDGADFTAALVGAALKAESIEIWTDMDGVMSADPEYVPEAFLIPELSFQEAMEMSYFGARIVHPRALIPAMEKGVPVRVRNINKPDEPGTLISNRIRKHTTKITGIASIDDVALINIEGGGMIGVPGIAARIFNALAGASVNIIMISQASSEHSICLALKQYEANQALKALRTELTEEIKAKQIQNFDLVEDLAIIAIIGENMRGTPGISGRLFSALGKESINILAIAQGSTERNISFLLNKTDEAKALCTIHQAFLGEPGKR